MRDYLSLRRRTPDRRGERPLEYERPELMALGDSLYNGVQSMRVNWFLSEWSVPTSVAIALGLVEEFRADRTGQRRFHGPQYPSHGAVPARTIDYGLPLETMPDSIVGTLRLPRSLADPLDNLLNGPLPDNRRAMIDNLAFSGANSHDLLFWTAEDHAKQAQEAIRRLSTDAGGIASRFGNLSTAFFHTNAAFVLNPMRDDCIAKMTPVDHVVLRKPRRLLVQIGPNDGLWLLAFEGVSTGSVACGNEEAAIRSATTGERRCARSSTGAAVSIAESMKAHYVSNIKRLMLQLSRVTEIEDVYLNNLPLPSGTANLVPHTVNGNQEWYSDFLSGRRIRTSVPAERISESDKLITEVNLAVAAAVAEANNARNSRGPRFHIVDVNAALAALDAKRCEISNPVPQNCTQRRSLVLQASRFKIPETVVMTNYPVRMAGDPPTPNSPYQTRLVQGGLFSFDNMHLSSVGYEVMAQAVISKMRSTGVTLLATYHPDGRERCLDPHQAGYEAMTYGDCATLLTTPGWSYADATRRTHVFLRHIDPQQSDNADRLSARLAFLSRLFNN
jgi:hypothetical protein